MLRFVSSLLVLTASLSACSNDPPNPPASTALPDAAAGVQAPPPAAGSGGQAGMPEPPPPPVDAGQKLDAGPPPAMDAMVHVIDDDDAGPWEPPAPLCVQGKWLLAPGFLVAQKVDYIADREADFGVTNPDGSFTTLVLSTAGMPCVNATDKPKCEAALAIPTTMPGRHLVTTSGDSVRVWSSGQPASNLLGVIDTSSEAIWWVSAMMGTYLVTCDVKVEPVSAGTSTIGFLLKNVYSAACGSTPSPMSHSPLDVMVRPNGETFELGTSNGSGTLCGPMVGMPGAGTGGFGGMGGF